MWVLFLLAAWAIAFASCGRLCHAALTTAAPAAAPTAAHPPVPARQLTLYETAFLAGGPHRLTDLALVSMARDGRLLLAPTGWATVIDPHGRDDIERTVITALGPGAQSPVPALRAAVAAAEAVRALADRLTAAGLAVPGAVRSRVTGALRQLRGAAVLVPVTGLAAEVLAGGGTGTGLRSLWFALPLTLVLGALAIARHEIRDATRWASPDGLRRLPRTGPGTAAAPDDAPAADRAALTALALHGPAVLAEPELRAALGADRAPLRPSGALRPPGRR